MRTKLFLALVTITTATITTACSNDTADIEPTFDNVFEHVLAPRCTFSACHAAPTKAAQLDLTKEVACRELVNKPSCLFPNRMRIIPGHPEESFFFHKLTGEGLSDVPTAGCSGETNALMPFGGSEIPEAEMQLVNAWIAAGASCDPGPMDPEKPDPAAPAKVSSMTANRTTPVAGESISVTVTLDKAAPAGGQMIEIEHADALYMPQQVFVSGGETTGRFEAYASKPASRFPLRVSTGGMTKELVIRVSGLSVAEVLADPIGADDNLQWIKLRNMTTVPISLAGYRIQAGQTSYNQTSAQLSGELAPGACIIVGGPQSSYTNGEPIIGQAVDFSPNLPNTGAQARGYAVFDGGNTPVDTMLVGQTNTAMLLGPDAEVLTPFCGAAPEGSSMKRTGAGACIISEMRPNQCP